LAFSIPGHNQQQQESSLELQQKLGGSYIDLFHVQVDSAREIIHVLGLKIVLSVGIRDYKLFY
jgi:hypothetical protein